MMDHAQLHAPLFEWFDRSRADYPWRRTSDPYTVWVSEIMLQQTRVASVIPYYERFLERFPTLADLAAAPLDDVLKRWEGLGYYSRARNLHRAVRIIVDELQGQIPSTVEGLRNLPGIGRYTAGAIASIAFGVDAPVVDGNIIRVLSRLADITEDVGKSSTQSHIWEIASSLVPSGRAGSWNEALMELGNRICTPRAPDCGNCPLADFCQAQKLGVQEFRPVKTPKSPTPHYDVTAGVIRRGDGRLLIAQRPTTAMLGGLWEFPGGKREKDESLIECLQREIREELGIEIRVGPQITTVRHAYSHFRITLYAFDCQYVEGEPQAIGCAAWEWVSPSDLERYAFPVTDQKIIAAINNGGQTSMDFHNRDA